MFKKGFLIIVFALLLTGCSKSIKNNEKHQELYKEIMDTGSVPTQKLIEIEIFSVDKGQGKFSDERLYKNKKSLEVLSDVGLHNSGEEISPNNIEAINSKGLQGTPYRFVLSDKNQRLYTLLYDNSILISGLQNIKRGISFSLAEKNGVFFQATQIGNFSGARSARIGYWYKNKFHEFKDSYFGEARLLYNDLYTLEVVGTAQSGEENFVLFKNGNKEYEFSSTFLTSSPIKDFVVNDNGRTLSYYDVHICEVDGCNDQELTGSGYRVIVNGTNITKQN